MPDAPMPFYALDYDQDGTKLQSLDNLVRASSFGLVWYSQLSRGGCGLAWLRLLLSTHEASSGACCLASYRWRVMSADHPGRPCPTRQRMTHPPARPAHCSAGAAPG